MRAFGADHQLEAPRRSSNISVIESETFTPRHNYNTRLSAKLSQTSLPKSNQPEVGNLYVDLTQSRYHVIGGTPSGSDILEPPDLHAVEPYRNTQSSKRRYFKSLRKFFTFNMDYCQDLRLSRNNNNYSCSVSALCAMCFVIAILAIGIPSHRLFNDIKGNVSHMRQEVDTMEMGLATKLANIENILKQMMKMQHQVQNKTEDIPDSCKLIQQIIKKELKKMESEKTERPDFAMASSGAKIVKLINTENLEPTKTGFFGRTCEVLHGPSTILNPDNAPGQCWAFKGSRGSVIVKLLGPVRIDGVTIDHISKAESPTGKVNSAPKDFVIKGLTDCESPKGQLLGQFTYDIDGPSAQTFEIPQTSYPYEFIEFTVLSNHGHPAFTCVYRLRVHGSFEAPTP